MMSFPNRIKMNRITVNLSNKELKNWFNKEGFRQATFESKYSHVSNYWGGQLISVKLAKKEGFDTFYKGAYGGATLVYDISLLDNELFYECYCPIWLFGMWTKKVSFKKDAGGIFKYRSEGFYTEQRFQFFLEKKKPNS